MSERSDAPPEARATFDAPSPESANCPPPRLESEPESPTLARTSARLMPRERIRSANSEARASTCARTRSLAAMNSAVTRPAPSAPSLTRKPSSTERRSSIVTSRTPPASVCVRTAETILSKSAMCRIMRAPGCSCADEVVSRRAAARCSKPPPFPASPPLESPPFRSSRRFVKGLSAARSFGSASSLSLRASASRRSPSPAFDSSSRTLANSRAAVPVSGDSMPSAAASALTPRLSPGLSGSGEVRGCVFCVPDGIFILPLLGLNSPVLLCEFLRGLVGARARLRAVELLARRVERERALVGLHRRRVLAQAEHQLAELVVRERVLRVQLGRLLVSLRRAQGLFEPDVAVAYVHEDFGRGLARGHVLELLDGLRPALAVLQLAPLRDARVRGQGLPEPLRAVEVEGRLLRAAESRQRVARALVRGGHVLV